MRFCLTEEQEKLRQEIHDFFQEELTEELALWMEEQMEKLAITETRNFSSKLAEKGWLALQQEKGVQEGALFEEAAGYWRVPVPFHNERIVITMIERAGTKEQQAYWLPRFAGNEITICLGYSEPGCGSDLAAVKTTAVWDGDAYILNGQKTFSSLAMVATHAITVVRTNKDVSKHKGISLFMVELSSPGVTARPLPMMGGYGVESAELFLEDVRVPAINLIGEIDHGWYHLATALDVQRVRVNEVGANRRLMDELVKFVNETEVDGKPLGQDPYIRDPLAQRHIEVEIARLLTYRSIWEESKGNAPPQYSAMGTMFIRETSQRLAQTCCEIMGQYAPLKKESKWAQLRGRAESLYRGAPALTIAGGTAEIHRNVIAQRGLGMPR